MFYRVIQKIITIGFNLFAPPCIAAVKRQGQKASAMRMLGSIGKEK